MAPQSHFNIIGLVQVVHVSDDLGSSHLYGKLFQSQATTKFVIASMSLAFNLLTYLAGRCMPISLRTLTATFLPFVFTLKASSLLTIPSGGCTTILGLTVMNVTGGSSLLVVFFSGVSALPYLAVSQLGGHNVFSNGCGCGSAFGNFLMKF